MSKYLQAKNIKTALIIVGARNGWFISSCWLFFWLEHFNYSEIGIIDSITVLIVFLLEIPFGALADIIGRKKVLIAAYITMIAGALLQATSSSQAPIAIGNILFYVGFSAQSGAFDAMVYDSLKSEHLEGEYPKYYSKASAISWIVNSLALIIGGITFNINPRIPFFLWATSYTVGLIFTLRLKEPIKEKSDGVTFKKYVKQNIDGIKELFSHYLKKFSPFILIVLGFIYFYDWSSLRPAIGKANDLDGLAQSLIYAFSAIPSVLIMQFMPYFKKHIADKWGAVILCVILAFTYYLFSLNMGHFAAIPMIILCVVSTLAYAWMIIIINDNVNTAHRATASAGMYTILKIPYIFLAFIAGQIIDGGGIFQLNLAIAGLIAAVAIVLAVMQFKKPLASIN